MASTRKLAKGFIAWSMGCSMTGGVTCGGITTGGGGIGVTGRAGGACCICWAVASMPMGQAGMMAGVGLLAGGNGTLQVGSPGAGSSRRTGGIGWAVGAGGCGAARIGIALGKGEATIGAGGGVPAAAECGFAGGKVPVVIENVAG